MQILVVVVALFANTSPVMTSCWTKRDFITIRPHARGTSFSDTWHRSPRLVVHNTISKHETNISRFPVFGFKAWRGKSFNSWPGRFADLARQTSKSCYSQSHLKKNGPGRTNHCYIPANHPNHCHFVTNTWDKCRQRTGILKQP